MKTTCQLKDIWGRWL